MTLLKSAWDRIKERLHFVFVDADYEPIEFRSSLIMLMYAFLVGNPYTNVFSNGIAYQVIRDFISENSLGTLMFFVALNSLTAFFSKNLKYRLFATAIQAVLWLILFILFLLGQVEVWFPWTLGPFFLFEAIIVARMYKDIKKGLWIGEQ